jgi:hypothetical protein
MSGETGLCVAVLMTEYVVGISLMVAGEVPSGEGEDTGTWVRTVVRAD